MQITNFISNLAMPMIILLIVIYGVKEKNKVFDTSFWISLLFFNCGNNNFITGFKIFVNFGQLNCNKKSTLE